MPYPNEVAALDAFSERVSRDLARLAHHGAPMGHVAEPLDEAVDNVRGLGRAHIVEYGDYECPYSRAAYREIHRVAREVEFRFAFRHFPLTEIHPRALAAAGAAEAASLQGHFWEMHDWLFHNQRTLADPDLHAAAIELALDVPRFDGDVRATPFSIASAATWRVGSPQVRCTGRRRSSSTASCTAGATARRLCVRRSRREGRVHRPRHDRADRSAGASRWLRRVPRDGRMVGSPAHVPALWPRLVLRQLAEQARLGACPRHRSSDRTVRERGEDWRWC
jgi:hypothetical protein